MSKFLAKIKFYGVQQKSFDDYIWEDINQVFGVNIVDYGNIIPAGPDVNQANVDMALNQWNFYTSIIKSFPGRNEDERKVYITSALGSIPVWDKMMCWLQYQVENTVINGCIDYAIFSRTGIYTPVVCIVVANGNKMAQGRAQVYVELISCYEMAEISYAIIANNTNFLKNLPLHVYGIVSTVKKWVFVRFDGENWLESEAMFIKDELDREGVNQVLNALNKILIHQEKSCKLIV